MAEMHPRAQCFSLPRAEPQTGGYSLFICFYFWRKRSLCSSGTSTRAASTSPGTSARLLPCCDKEAGTQTPDEGSSSSGRRMVRTTFPALIFMAHARNNRHVPSFYL